MTGGGQHGMGAVRHQAGGQAALETAACMLALATGGLLGRRTGGLVGNPFHGSSPGTKPSNAAAIAPTVQLQVLRACEAARSSPAAHDAGAHGEVRQGS